MKRTLQPLTQARIQASKEGIAPTNLPPRSRISQDPKRSSQQTTPFYNARRNATKKNTQQHNRFWEFWESSPLLSFRLLAAWDPLPLWYTERLPPSLLIGCNSPTAEPFSGWDARWASPSCAQLSCTSSFHHPAGPSKIVEPINLTCSEGRILSKANYMNQTNSLSVSYCSSFMLCCIVLFWESFFIWLTQCKHIYIYDKIV